jgi:hypothetical protein
MANFDQDIQNYRRYGTYTYKFDNVGNVVLNPSSSNFNQVYIAFPLQNAVFDNSKIETMYNVNFEEFIPQPETTSSVNIDDLLQTIDNIQNENVLLKTQLDSVVSRNENVSTTNPLATKQVILELRKALGEGLVDSDFSDTFPYTPIRKDAS